MQGEQRTGFTYSALLHGALLFLMLVGLPSFFDREVPPQPIVVSVEVLPISSITNIKPSDEPLSEHEKKPEPTPEPPKPTPPVKTESDTPPPPPPEPKKAAPKKEEKKPEPKKPEEKPTKAKEKDLEAVLKAVRESAEKKPTEVIKKQKPKEDGGTKTRAKNTNYDASQPMSISELDAIRSQIAKCWSVPAGAKDAHELQVTLRVQLAQDGSVMQVELASDSKSRYSGDSFFRAAADSAIRAVRQCSPLKGLPEDKYNTWRDMEMTFDPKEMLF